MKLWQILLEQWLTDLQKLSNTEHDSLAEGNARVGPIESYVATGSEHDETLSRRLLICFGTSKEAIYLTSHSMNSAETREQ